MQLGSILALSGPWRVAVYRQEKVYERHRRRCEFNNIYREALTGAGLTADGIIAGQHGS